MKIGELREQILKRLTLIGAQAQSESRMLFRDLLGIDPLCAVIEPETELSDAEVSKVLRALERRERREPLQYILGFAYFRTQKLKVGPGVLIPRPETELMVDWLRSRANRAAGCGEPARFLEIGTGSGAISIALASELSQDSPAARFHIDAVDVSPDALSIARENVESAGVSNHVTLIGSDLDSALPPEWRYDLIFSNPPYIAESERASLEPEVALYEPCLALYAGDGLDVIRRIAQMLPRRLTARGAAILEIGRGQDEEVARLIRNQGFARVETLQDYRGIRRFVACLTD